MKTRPTINESTPSRNQREKDSFLSRISSLKFMGFALDRQLSATRLIAANPAAERMNNVPDTQTPLDIELLSTKRMPVSKFTPIDTNAPAMNAQREGVIRNQLSGGTKSYHFLRLGKFLLP